MPVDPALQALPAWRHAALVSARGWTWLRLGVADHGAVACLHVAPADVDSPAHTADEVRNFSPIPLVRLPFPSIVVASTNDPFVTPARAATFARAWGSRLVTFERAGHLNADAGFGPWPEGRRLLAELTKG